MVGNHGPEWRERRTRGGTWASGQDGGAIVVTEGSAAPGRRRLLSDLRQRAQRVAASGSSSVEREEWRMVRRLVVRSDDGCAHCIDRHGVRHGVSLLY